MKIAIDIDGVLLALMETFCEIYNKKFNTNYQKIDVNKWEFFKDWNLTEEQCYEIFNLIYENTMQVPLIDEVSSEFMKKLNIKHHIDILSARNSQHLSQLIKKLNSHNIRKGIQYNELILVDHKPYDIKLNYKYDIYVDDNPNLVKPMKTMKDRFLLLFDQPWNLNCVCEKNVIRVNNWKETYEMIKDLEKY